MSVYDETIIQLQAMQLISVRHELEESKRREAELQTKLDQEFEYQDSIKRSLGPLCQLALMEDPKRIASMNWWDGIKRSFEILTARVKTLEDYAAWRPISEIHEDYGPCLVINLIEDPGYLEVHWSNEVAFEESGWTHFARAPQLLTETAMRLIEEHQQALAAKEPK